MSKNLIRALYLSNLDLAGSVSEQYSQIRDKSISKMNDIMQKLCPENQDLLDEYLSLHNSSELECDCHAFEQGFSLAIQLIFNGLLFDFEK